MSNVQKFEELLRSDEGLQEKLREATEAYDGNKEDERAVFDAVVAPLAAEAGLPFAYEEAREYATGVTEFSADDLAIGTGGHEDYLGQPDGSCIFIGFGCGADACSNERSGAGACIGFGVGLFGF